MNDAARDRARARRNRTIYLSDEQADQVEALERQGIRLGEVVRAGLAAIAGQGAGPLVVILRPDGTYTMQRGESR